MSSTVSVNSYRPPAPPPVIEDVTITLDPSLAKRLAVLLYYTTQGSGELDALGFHIRQALAEHQYPNAHDVDGALPIVMIKEEIGDLLSSSYSVLREVMRKHMNLDVRTA